MMTDYILSTMNIHRYTQTTTITVNIPLLLTSKKHLSYASLTPGPLADQQRYEQTCEPIVPLMGSSRASRTCRAQQSLQPSSHSACVPRESGLLFQPGSVVDP
jgi:hypothetical protein